MLFLNFDRNLSIKRNTQKNLHSKSLITNQTIED